MTQIKRVKDIPCQGSFVVTDEPFDFLDRRRFALPGWEQTLRQLDSAPPKKGWRRLFVAEQEATPLPARRTSVLLLAAKRRLGPAEADSLLTAACFAPLRAESLADGLWRCALSAQSGDEAAAYVRYCDLALAALTAPEQDAAPYALAGQGSAFSRWQSACRAVEQQLCSFLATDSEQLRTYLARQGAAASQDATPGGFAAFLWQSCGLSLLKRGSLLAVSALLCLAPAQLNELLQLMGEGELEGQDVAQGVQIDHWLRQRGYDQTGLYRAFFAEQMSEADFWERRYKLQLQQRTLADGLGLEEAEKLLEQPFAADTAALTQAQRYLLCWRQESLALPHSDRDGWDLFLE